MFSLFFSPSGNPVSCNTSFVAHKINRKLIASFFQTISIVNDFKHISYLSSLNKNAERGRSQSKDTEEGGGRRGVRGGERASEGLRGKAREIGLERASVRRRESGLVWREVGT